MMADRELIDEFHNIYYGCPEQTIYNTHWLGVAAQKYPADLWVYQEILAELRPDYVIETGTYWGGSALYLASICELLGHGHVITIDSVDMATSKVTRPEHPRITYLTGSSVESSVVGRVRELVAGKTAMVILDSDHSREHVVNELKIYQEFVTPGSYLIVEDTNINGHPVLPEFGPGPMEALELFLDSTAEFLPDRSREKFLVTANPGGFLRRVELGGLQARLLETERQLELERARAQEAEALVQARDVLLDDRKRQLFAAEEELAARRAQLSAVEGDLAARMSQLAGAEQQLVDADEQLTAAGERLAAAGERLAELDRTLAEEQRVRHSMQHSVSWRITTVLRDAKRLVRRRP
jgi:cephalosporin hydroxylase